MIENTNENGGVIITGDCRFENCGMSGVHVGNGASLINYGSLITRGNTVDGIHVEDGGSFTNHGHAIQENNGRHGVFLGGDTNPLKDIIAQIEELMNTSYVAGIRDQVQPHIAQIKAELKQPNKSKEKLKQAFNTIGQLARKVTANIVTGALAKLGENGLAYIEQLPEY